MSDLPVDSQVLSCSKKTNPAVWRDLTQKNALGILFGVCAFFIVTMAWAFQESCYTYDFFRYAYNALCSKSWTATLLARDIDLRYRPGVFSILRIEYMLFGLSQNHYYVLGFLFHCANGLAIFLLARRFSAGNLAALAASLLFVTSCLNWGSFLEPHSIIRYLSLLFFILGTLTFDDFLHRKKSGISLAALASFLSSLLFAEDGAGLPLVLLATTILSGPRDALRPRLRRAAPTLVLCLGVSAAVFVYVKMFIAGHGYDLYYGWHSLQKLIVLPRETLQHLFIPRREWGLPDSLPVRLVPLILLFGSSLALYFTTPKRDRSSRLKENAPLIVFSIAWILVTSLPCLARPSGWTWFSRYFYLPSVGIFLLAGMFAEECARRVFEIFSSKALTGILISAVAAYMVVFGVFSSVVMRQAIFSDVRRYYAVGLQEAEMLFPLLYEISGLHLQEGEQIHLSLPKSPFEKNRLQGLLENYNIRHKILWTDGKENLPGDRIPLYELEYRQGHWGKITRLGDRTTARPPA